MSPKKSSSSERSVLLDQDNEHYTSIDTMSRPTKYNLKAILPAIWLGSFLSAMDGTIVANIMSGIAAEFDQEELKSWIATSYLLTNTAFQPLYGKVSDIIGRKYALMIAQFFFGLGCFLSIFSRNIQQFALARAISGIGGGGIAAMSSIIASDIVSLEDRGLFQGYSNVNYAAGQMIGAPFGGYALATIGWRWTFGLQAPAVLICSVLAYRNINIPPVKPFSRQSLTRIDFGGSFTLVSVIATTLLILSTDLNKRTLLIILVISLSAFLYIEKYIAKEQIIPADLFKGVLGVCAILSLLTSFMLYCMLFSIPVYLQILQNLDARESGKYLIPNVLSVSVGSLSAGWLLRKFGNDIKKTSMWITFLSVSFLLLADTTIWLVIEFAKPYDGGIQWRFILIVALGIIGFSYGHVLVSVLVTTIAIVGKEGQATATGVNYLFRSIGQVNGVGLSLSLYENTLRKRLSALLKSVPHGKEILKRLLNNASYIKNGDLISDSLRVEILNEYQHSMSVAYIPSIGLGAVAAIITLALVYRRSF